MKFNYKVEGGNHSVDIEDNYISLCSDLDDAVDYIKDRIRQDFDENIGPAFDEDKIREKISDLFK